MAQPITVLIVEDHRLMVEGLASLLGEVAELRVVGTAGSVKEAIEAAQTLRPQVVLMDFRLPDGDGPEATERIRHDHPEVAVLFLSADVSDDAMMRAIDAGACGYISSSCFRRRPCLACSPDRGRPGRRRPPRSACLRI